MGIGSLPCLFYLLWYNYSITGNALLPVTMWAYPAEQLGFVKGHSVFKGLEHLARRALMFIYWTLLVILLLIKPRYAKSLLYWLAERRLLRRQVLAAAGEEVDLGQIDQVLLAAQFPDVLDVAVADVA